MVEPHSLLAHVLAQTRQNVQLLMAQKHISQADGEEILTRLSVDGEGHGEEISVVQRLKMSPGPPKVEARTIWGWTSEDANDLSFEAGEIIEVISETNADWWTGRSRSGRQGLFPSNYVERLPPRNLSPILVPEPRKSVTSAIHSRYSSPALPHPPPHTPPQTYYPPPVGYYLPAGPPPGAVNHGYAPPPAPMPQPVAQQAGKKSKFGALGQVMAQSAAGGAGFGAGAAIGGGLVNSIF